MQTVIRTVLRATIYQLVRRIGVRGTILLGTAALALFIFTQGASAAELGYGQITADKSITGTSGGSQTDVVSSGAVTYDGTSKVEITFHCPRVNVPASSYLILTLWDASTELGRIGAVEAGAYQAAVGPMTLTTYLTPSAASHTYRVRAYSNTGTAEMSAASPYDPCFVRTSSESAGGGATALDSLTDVDLTGRTDGSILEWDSSAAMWEMGTDADGAGAGGTVSLSDGDRERLDLNWWGVWALVGLTLILIIAPAFTRVLDIRHGMGAR